MSKQHSHHLIKRARRLNRPGFSLIELIIVISILSIMAAMVIPRFSAAQTDALNTNAKANLSMVRKKIAEYYAMNGQWPADLDPNWFAGGDLPDNPYASDGNFEIVIQSDFDKIYLKNKCLDDGGPIWWYNTANGSFQSRVPWAGSEEETLALFNDVNGTNATGWSQMTP